MNSAPASAARPAPPAPSLKMASTTIAFFTRLSLKRAAGLGQAERAEAAGKQQSVHDTILRQRATISAVKPAGPGAKRP